MYSLYRYAKMETSHSGEAYGHPHRSLTSLVYPNLREVIERSALEVVYISSINPLKYQILRREEPII